MRPREAGKGPVAVQSRGENEEYVLSETRKLVEQTAATVPDQGYTLAAFMEVSLAKSACTVAAICSSGPLFTYDPFPCSSNGFNINTSTNIVR